METLLQPPTTDSHHLDTLETNLLDPEVARIEARRVVEQALTVVAGYCTQNHHGIDDSWRFPDPEDSR